MTVSMRRSATCVALMSALSTSLLGAVAPFDASATFPGRNGLIAYEGGPARCPQDIVVSRADGSQRSVLTKYGCGSSFAAWPAWSPNGTRLLYVESDDNPAVFPPMSRVVVMRRDGSRKSTAARGEIHSVEWGPNGQLAWYLGGDRSGVYVGPFDNPRERFITDGFQPSWSPDGRSLAVAEGAEWCIGIRIFDPATAGVRRTLIEPRETSAGCVNSAWAPDWSPNGRRIVYAGTGGRPGAPDNAEIFVIGHRGGKLRRLTRNTAQDSHPAWSPDGRWVAFTRRERNVRRSDLYVMRADGSGKRRVARYAGAPAWQPLRQR